MAELSLGSLPCGVKDFIIGKVEGRALNCPHPSQDSKSEPRMAEISATLQDGKDTGVVAPIISPFGSAVEPL